MGRNAGRALEGGQMLTRHPRPLRDCRRRNVRLVRDLFDGQPHIQRVFQDCIACHPAFLAMLSVRTQLLS